MAWTEQDYQEIVARLMAGSIGVNEVPNAEDLDNISSLPAYQPANETGAPTVVKASLELLAAPALEAADKANAAATKAEENATAAQTAANTANEKAELAAQAASDANAAKEGAETATQSANNAASNAEEKAAAANTAAQDAEKVANNPTYIGKDHYVYVYNKETDSFDKTDIYCKGEPGSSFRVSGEYATLEALKSAVPDGSAVDGFMAVGTEAPYDYYAWVNGDWANQGKIAGGGSGNVVVIPAATTNLSDQSTSEEIFEVFGGKQSLIDIIKEIKSTEDCIVVASDNDINSASKIVFSSVSVVYTDDNNMALSLIAWTVNITAQMVIQIVNGVASCLLNTTPLMTEAPSNGNAYGRKNEKWVEVPEKSDVLTKDNETEYTPTKPYQPATKKYVDDKVYVVNNSTWEEVLRNNKSINGTDVQALINKLFGTYSTYLSFLQGVNENVYNSLKFTDWMYDDVNEYSVGSSYTAGNLYAKHNTAEGEFNCNFTYFYNNALKSCIINVNEASNHNLDVLVVQDIVTSDNLTTITKKTAAEYEALGSKDANTAYCVTD